MKRDRNDKIAPNPHNEIDTQTAKSSQDRKESISPHDDPAATNPANTREATGDEKPRALDPFDPSRLRLSQDFAQSLGVKRALLTIPVRKPSKEWWIQTHSDEAYRMETMVLELKEDREVYLVEPELWPELATESTFGPRALFTAINRQGVLFLWPIRLPGQDGKHNEWNRSALEAATMAAGHWIRVQANMSLGAYEVYQATADLPEPNWPGQPMGDLLRIAFKDHHITSLDHPVLRRLRGEE